VGNWAVPLAEDLFTDKAQQIVAEEGFRPTNAIVWERGKAKFAPVKQLVSVNDFGIWDRLFAQAR
jgi:sulfate/thiosulfate transport system substrate-binding protein